MVSAWVSPWYRHGISVLDINKSSNKTVTATTLLALLLEQYKFNLHINIYHVTCRTTLTQTKTRIKSRKISQISSFFCFLIQACFHRCLVAVVDYVRYKSHQSFSHLVLTSCLLTQASVIFIIRHLLSSQQFHQMHSGILHFPF